MVFFFIPLLTVLAGCDQQSGPEEAARLRGKYRIAFVGPSPGLAGARYYKHAAISLQRQVPSIELSFFDPPAESLESLQDAVSKALAAQPEALVVYVASDEFASAAVEAARFATVPIATFGPVEDTNARCGHVYIDTPAAAELLGKRLNDVSGGGRSFVLVHRRSEGGIHERMYLRFTTEADRSGLRCLGQADVRDASGLAARASVEGLLEQFPYAPLVVSLDASVWMEGPWRPLPQGCAFATIGAYPALWPHLRDGSATGLAGHLDGHAAMEACKLTYEWLIGSRKGTNIRVINPTLVTPAHLEAFEREYNEAAGSPND